VGGFIVGAALLSAFFGVRYCDNDEETQRRKVYSYRSTSNETANFSVNIREDDEDNQEQYDEN